MFTGKLWVARVSFVVYIMAIQSVMGECSTYLCVTSPMFPAVTAVSGSSSSVHVIAGRLSTTHAQEAAGPSA